MFIAHSVSDCIPPTEKMDCGKYVIFCFQLLYPFVCVCVCVCVCVYSLIDKQDTLGRLDMLSMDSLCLSNKIYLNI